MHIADFAELLTSTGPYGVASLALGWGWLERRERQRTQAKYEHALREQPRDIMALVDAQTAFHEKQRDAQRELTRQVELSLSSK